MQILAILRLKTGSCRRSLLAKFYGVRSALQCNTIVYAARVSPSPHSGRVSKRRSESPEKAKEMAASCAADACTLGMTIDDMWLEWGSIESIVYAKR
jgi:hypothetical protein